ncbi:MAG: TMEM165/GDT1 family protein [Candidatus Omnitrophota bacterium]|nr:TMEM165/GDT1 family protein [Candidatus Omnitrophota bacterium]
MFGKIFVATFSAIFLAELADKTQIVGMGLSSRSGHPWTVWLGSVAAYMLVTLITVFLGSMLGRYIKPDLIKYIGGTVFVIIGILMFFNRI